MKKKDENPDITLRAYGRPRQDLPLNPPDCLTREEYMRARDKEAERLSEPGAALVAWRTQTWPT